MKIRASTIENVALTAPDGSVVLPVRFPPTALAYSVAVHNRASLAIAFLGVRFDFLKPDLCPAASMHYADTLRYPDRAAIVPGSSRFVCMEHGVTDAVLRGVPLDEMPGAKRIFMNLENLGKMSGLRASLDCVVFADGRFHGPDTGGAFDRLTAEIEAESRFVRTLLDLEKAPDAEFRPALEQALSTSSLKRFASLPDLWKQRGRPAVLAALQNYPFRIPLTRI